MFKKEVHSTQSGVKDAVLVLAGNTEIKQNRTEQLYDSFPAAYLNPITLCHYCSTSV